jgi:hypothetical protein
MGNSGLGYWLLLLELVDWNCPLLSWTHKQVIRIFKSFILQSAEFADKN